MNKTEELIKAAAEAREKAYAPYSHFHVGAAVLASSEKIYTGCNVENVSYGLTICAERVAVGCAVAAGEREITAVAIVSEERANPCGACLQVILEFAGKEPPVIITSAPDGSHIIRSLDDYLPFGFKEFESKA